VRVRFVVLLAIALLAAGAGAGVAVTRSSDGGTPAATAVADPPPTDYCSFARDALQYEGHDAKHQAVLFARVLKHAPSEVAPSLRTVEHATPGTFTYAAAHRLWDYFNNNHCCQCIDARIAPEISALTPEQRKIIEDGKDLNFK
jgi:hypothetical protein